MGKKLCTASRKQVPAIVAEVLAALSLSDEKEIVSEIQRLQECALELIELKRSFFRIAQMFLVEHKGLHPLKLTAEESYQINRIITDADMMVEELQFENYRLRKELKNLIGKAQNKRQNVKKQVHHGNKSGKRKTSTSQRVQGPTKRMD